MDVNFTLLENGLDSMAYGIRQIRDAESKRDLKHGCIALDGGIELILKERLRREHWRLIFADQEQADERAYKSGDFRSVDVPECLKRLANETTADVPPKLRKRVKAFRRRRNKMQHFQFAETKTAIESASAELLAVVLDFVNSELSVDSMTEEEQRLLEE